MIFLILVFIGFANALPVSIAGSNLSIYLTENGFGKDVIGLFSLLSIPFALKVFWAPLIDRITLPLFRQSPRKGWLFFALIGMACALVALAASSQVALSIFFLSLFSGCLYMVGIAYELESIDDTRYSMGSACSIAGYRTGLLVGGAGALYIANLYSWEVAITSLAAMLLVGAIGILFRPEPYKSAKNLFEKRRLYAGFWNEVLGKPFRAFLQSSQWPMILCVLLLFKMGDHLAKAMDGPFYLDLGFDKADLALATKTWGFVTALIGAFFAGIYLKGKDPLSSVALFGLVHAFSLCGNWLLALNGQSYLLLYATVTVAHFTGAMGITAFIFLLWRTSTKEYAAQQYALLWSLFSLFGHLLACCGGFLAKTLSWPTFYLVVTSTSVFSAFLLWMLVAQKYPRLVNKSRGDDDKFVYDRR